MSAKKDEKTDGDKKKGGGLLLKLGLGLGLLAAGAGGVFGLMAAGVIGTSAAAEADRGPQLVRKGETDPYAPAAEGGDDGVTYVPGEAGSEYRTAYYTFGGEFTSNLANSDAMVQLSLAASTQRDGRVLMWLARHELAIRSQLLVDIADTDAASIVTPEGKRALQERMVASINRVLTEREGFGGVDQVYFRSFIVQ